MIVSVKTEFNNLSEQDIWSLLLFAMFNMKNDEKYSCISELAFIFDKTTLFKFCEYFGGTTIKVPTISQLELLLKALLLYKYLDIDNIEYDDAIKKLDLHTYTVRDVKDCYYSIKDVLSNYTISHRCP